MKPTEFLREFDTMEDEQLDGMALGELKAIAQAAEKIYNSVKSGTPLEAWMYKKITNGNEGLTAVAQQINNPEIREPQHNTLESAPDYSDMFEGTIYDMDKEYGAPAPGKKPLPHGGSMPRRHNDDPDFMDPDQRRLRADQARVKKAQDEYHAKKKSGMAEGEIEKTPTGIIHRAEKRQASRAPEMDRLDKGTTNNLDKGIGVHWDKTPGRGRHGIIDPTVNEQGVAEGSTNDYFKRRKDEEDRIAGKKAPAKRTPRQTDYEKKRKEQGVAEKITPPGKDDMEQYRKDTANMAKAAIVNKTPLSKNQVNEFAGGMGASSVGSAPGVGKGPKVGSLFGGSYAPKTPFNKKRKK